MNELSSLSGAFEYINESGIKINGLSNVNTSLSIHYIIYKIDNCINGKYYIGQHKTNNPFDNYMGSGKLIIAAEKKYGLSAFIKTILFDFDNFNEMNNKEQELVPDISCHQYNEKCYNFIQGGSFHMVLSGKLNPMYGKCSEDFMSPEAIKEKRKKQAEASKRRKWKKSTRIKISQGKIGELNPMYGKPSNKMPHYNKKCMKCLETGKYEYIDKALVDDYLNHGYILEGSNKNIKPSKQSRKLNSLSHIGRKYMIHPITKDRKNP